MPPRITLDYTPDSSRFAKAATDSTACLSLCVALNSHFKQSLSLGKRPLCVCFPRVRKIHKQTQEQCHDKLSIFPRNVLPAARSPRHDTTTTALQTCPCLCCSMKRTLSPEGQEQKQTRFSFTLLAEPFHERAMKQQVEAYQDKARQDVGQCGQSALGH
jgi:hypothetical protein